MHRAPSELFELTKEISDGIVFAMEDQQTVWQLDPATGIAVSSASDRGNSAGNGATDSAVLIDLPEWKPADGFRLMESFAAGIHNPVAVETIRSALSSHQGVFRKFKDVLRRYPDIERQWFAFKDSYMLQYVRTWYNSLREAYGLAKIGSEPEETGEIIAADFSFSRQTAAAAAGFMQQCKKQFCDDTANRYSADVAVIMQSLTVALGAALEENAEVPAAANVLLAETPDGAPAAFFSVCQYTETVCITGGFVLPEYRGLGLATSMIEQCIADSAAAGFKRLGIIAFPGNSFYRRSLENRGFVQDGCMMFLDLDPAT